MKDLEDDAIRAQAVIVKAQELQKDENKAANNQNGEPEVGRQSNRTTRIQEGVRSIVLEWDFSIYS